MNIRKSIIIGTAGHIDHGKTALVKALTGVDTDRLPEEKARGITIDIGFAHLDLDEVEISFIDVPGHERFVRNMLAGVGGIDMVMLMVAADESIMPQTREHFEICRLLNIRSGIVVITKKDLVEKETLQIVRTEISALVQGSFLEKAPVFAVSSKTGEGIAELKAVLPVILQKLEQRQPQGVFRLPVDRVFTLKGHGTVITGTLLSGRIGKDHSVLILPSGIRTRIRSIHAHNTSVEEAVAGQRTALNLQGIEREQVQRGDVITEPDILQPTSLLDVRISLLQNSKPLVNNALVRLHHQTSDVLARVTLLGKEGLLRGESVFAQMRLQKPIVAVYGDRFVLRRHSPLQTIGGGVILDHLPERRISAKDTVASDRLQLLEQASPPEHLSIAVKQKGILGAEEAYLKAKLALPEQAILQIRSDDVVFLRERPILAITRTSEDQVLKELQDFTVEFHQKYPLLPGIPKEELRSRLHHISTEVFLAMLGRAANRKLLQIEKDIVIAFGRTVSLSRQDETLAKSVEDFLLRSGLEWPGLEELSRETRQEEEKAKRILYLLVRQGNAIKMGEDYFIHKDHWQRLKQTIKDLKTTRKAFTVPDFKTLFGVSRKYAIPLLEQLDREGVTRRSANERIIL